MFLFCYDNFGLRLVDLITFVECLADLIGSLFINLLFDLVCFGFDLCLICCEFADGGVSVWFGGNLVALGLCGVALDCFWLLVT